MSTDEMKIDARANAFMIYSTSLVKMAQEIGKDKHFASLTPDELATEILAAVYRIPVTLVELVGYIETCRKV